MKEIWWWTVEFNRSNGGQGSVCVRAEDLRRAMVAAMEQWSEAFLPGDVEIRIARADRAHEECT